MDARRGDDYNGRMRGFHHGLLALALGLAGTACQRETLTEVAVPDEGVRLRYQLAAGQSLSGHFRLRSAASTPGGELINRLEYDVTMAVLEDQESPYPVQAVVSNVAFERRAPDSIPAKFLDEQGFTDDTAAAINGLELTFFLSEEGDVTEMPEPPTDVAVGLRAMLGMVTTGVKAGLPRVPDKAVTKGDSWDALSAGSVPSGQTATGTGSLSGLATDEGGRNLAQLLYEYEQSGTTKTPLGDVDFRLKANLEALFVVSDGHAAHVEGHINRDAMGQSETLELTADWTRAH